MKQLTKTLPNICDREEVQNCTERKHTVKMKKKNNFPKTFFVSDVECVRWKFLRIAFLQSVPRDKE